MSDFSKLIASLSPEKRKLLEMQLQNKGSNFNTFPLSFAQQRLWFLNQLEPGSAAYNIPIAVRLLGNINHVAIETSLNEIMKRHEILRTHFTTVSDSPMQVISDPKPLKIQYVDLSEISSTKKEKVLREKLTNGMQTVFELSEAPLLRVTLYSMAPDEHVLFVVMHHIISDGWSVGVFVREFSLLYSSIAKKIEPNLPQLPIQYADFAQWQRKWLKGENRKNQVSFWKNQLGDIPPVLELPSDHPRPAVRSYRGNTIGLLYPEYLLESLKKIAQQQGSTLFMLLLAAFKVLLFRYSGQIDISVGTPIANRHRQETEGLIGFFVNTLVLRSRFTGDDSFLQLLKTVRETTLEAFNHQDLPFEMLVEELHPERDMSHTPLFQVMFVHQTMPSGELNLPDLTLEPVEIQNNTAKFDITLSVAEKTGEGLYASIEYDLDLFENETIRRMLDHYKILLMGIAANPNSSIKDLPILAEDEKKRILYDWNAYDVKFPLLKCAHQVFEEQAEIRPQAVALKFEQQQFTYEMLNKKSNQLAHFLQKRGVKPDVLIGLYLERDADLIISILAVLKAGGAYLPMDPVYPSERLAFMLQDAQVPIVITKEKLLENLPACDAEMLCVDRDATLIEDELQTNPESGVKPENLIYCIYTSGSTGKPKGTLLTHYNVVRLFQASEHWFQFGPDDVWTLFHSFAFDFSVWEIWGPLFYGGKLIIVPFMKSRSPEAFYELLADEKITVLNQTPSAFQQLIRAEENKVDNSKDLALRYVIFGGEALDFSSLKHWFERHGDQRPRLINMYGITETTVHVTYRCVGLQDVEKSPGSIVGRPIPDLQVYILDSQLNPVPIGVPGEIHVGGAGVAKGYLNRPDLTAQKFINNPFTAGETSLLYKSGDLGRFLGNGDIEYIGRIDSQVKIRGFRVELGEIETLLSQHPSIRNAIVLIREDTPGDKRIVAYTIPAEQESLNALALRDYLKDVLPEYMIPSAFILMDEFPLTTNGKIDRRALPAPDLTGHIAGHNYVAPRTPAEEIIANTMAKILNVQKVGINDSFFELGGHSLLATQFVSRLRDAFKVELSLRVLFECPTISGLAHQIDELQHEKQGFVQSPIEPISRDQKLPLSYSQQRLWFLDQLEPGSASYNIPSAFRMEGELNIDVLEECFREISRRHEVMRTIINTTDGKPEQIILPESDIIFPLIDLTSLSEESRQREIDRVIFTEATRAFNLSIGPLIRIVLIEESKDCHIIFLNMHHIISDGWSMGVLIEEVAVLYQAFSQMKPSPLPELQIQYADFANWQRNWLKGEVYKKQLDYWKEKLIGGEHILNLPSDRTRPISQTFRGKHLPFVISQDLMSKLTMLSRQEGVTAFMLLLAAFKTLLFHYTRQADISVGTPVANRNRSDTEKIIGFFVNTLVMRTNLSGDPTFRNLLQKVRETALGAYAHQDIPFEQLVEAIQPERDLSHTPLFQVMFVLQNLPGQKVELPGMEISALDVENGISQFDLTLTLVENDGALRGTFEYNSDMFDESTIQRMSVHFQNLLKGIAANPQKHISEFPLLSDVEQLKLLVEWNETTAPFPSESCLHQLFSEQAKRSPDAIAVIDGDFKLTYEQLERRSNQLGHFLQKAGVEPESLVGLSIGRSSDLMVGILGILKAGGAYVPLDPNYPRERLAYMLDDSGLNVLVTTSAIVDKFPKQGTRTICLDNEWDKILAENTSIPKSNVASKNAAYMIYTSGSTGRPKGVQVTHRSVVNHNFSAMELFRLSASDRVLQFATINFDAALEEIFPTWFSGATIVLRSNDILISGEELSRLIDEQNITVVDLPTAYWHEWVSELALNSHKIPSSLRLVVLGGDKASPEKYALWNRVGGSGIQLLNTYGPTEATIVCTAFEPTVSPNGNNIDLPIGRPIKNTRVFILDNNFRPVPIGVPGELCVGGEGIARGYFRRPDLTAEKFVPDPFGPDTSARLYRTGDLVRYLPDGNIQFLGRVDQQVKIRGYRIEISEIEDALIQHPDLKEVAVVAREDEPGAKRLVAYCIPGFKTTTKSSDRRRYMRVPFNDTAKIKDDYGKQVLNQTENISLGGISLLTNSSLLMPKQAVRVLVTLSEQNEPVELNGVVSWQHDDRIGIQFVNITNPQKHALEEMVDQIIREKQIFLGELRGFLLAKLPEYMVPSTFVLLDELPKTPSGKIDRKALPKPEDNRPDLQTDFIAPRTQTEKTLAEIIKDVLGIQKVGIRDNFFELGGDSIQSIQVIARAKQAGLEVTPMQIFQYQTIEKLSAVVGTARVRQAEQGTVVGEVPLTPIQHWFFEQEFPEVHHWNQSLLLEVRQQISLNTLRKLVVFLTSYHDVLRLRFHNESDEWKQVNYDVNGSVPFSYVDLSGMREEASFAAIQDACFEFKQSLHLSDGPILRMAYFYLGKNKPGRLFLTIHHLAIDGVSWRILMEDIQVVLQQLSNGQDILLAPKTSSFRQWSERLLQYAQSEKIHKELSHWSAISTANVHPLPVDFVKGINSEASMVSTSVSMSEEETEALLQEIPSVYNTQINEVLLTGVLRGYSRWSGKRTLLIDLEGHGREELFDDLDISRTVGWFTTVYPAFLDLKTTIDAGDSLKTVKEQLRKIPNHGIGYGILRYLAKEPTVRGSIRKVPRAEISFNYLGQFDRILHKDSPFGPAMEDTGLDRHPHNQRSYLLDVEGMINNKKLHLRLLYSQNIFKPESMDEFARHIIAELKEIILQAKMPQEQEYTSSDFPMANLNQDKLNKVLEKLGKRKL